MNRFVAALFCVVAVLSSTVFAAEGIPWQSWSEAVFEQARKENRFVLLDLEAVWCHWCHVMDDQTYHDDAVMKLIRDRYIAVRADQDARPDLSRRYEDYGWPATIVFAPDGTEIVKRSGYVPAQRFASMLAAVIKDPTPVKYRDSEPPGQFSASPLLPEDVRRTLKKSFADSHDFKLGGLLQQQKFMDRDSVEYALMLAASGDQQARGMATQTLAGSLNLVDPVWGGVYQYSTGNIRTTKRSCSCRQSTCVCTRWLRLRWATGVISTQQRKLTTTPADSCFRRTALST
jgi:uncharacterized protein YyaL (SSP411 family)